MTIFITGTAGFIGYHVAARLLALGHSVVGFDGMTSYYDVSLKRARLARLAAADGFTFTEGMLEDRPALKAALDAAQSDVVIHLAAQAGVRYAFEAPEAYLQSNVVGTFNLLELLKTKPPRHLLFASTSSIYGGNADGPSRETDRTDFQMSLYAATKKSGEAMCHSYAHLFGIPTTALRFFTVYGPWGRPDMALFTFVRKMLAGEPIDIYGEGRMRRDFTYIDDLIDATVGLIDVLPDARARGPSDSLSPVAPYRAVNLAGGKPVELMTYVEAIEAALGQRAIKNFLPMQPGDVVDTHASPELLHDLVGAVPKVDVHDGVARFVAWYREHYQGS
ncbi:NAD-dependent epimerase/dehydratase family protein [Devosia sp. CN2-171]|uniref:NAD-dependent epimerase/dehydratase family protein n=1 Tax=Devosia sp. CN2-171 TaxID=3400909 RepID=UPI003BF92871